MKLLDHITQEHKELLPEIERLKTVADRVGVEAAETLQPMIEEAHEFLSEHLIPHAQLEDVVLYPLIARYSGTTAATDIMSREHAEVGVLTDRLEELLGSKTDETALRDVLYSLHALVLLHFKKEEEFFLPVLRQHLTEEDDQAAAHRLHHS